MKLLFDENLSPRLVARLADLYPDSVHVKDVGLERASDGVVWSYAQENALTIVTKDADFGEMTVLFHSPAKVIWIRGGNCSTSQIEALLRFYYEGIAIFHDSPDSGVLTLFGGEFPPPTPN